VAGNAQPSLAARWRPPPIAAAALLLLSVAALGVGGCGHGHKSTPAALRLEREDLIAVTHALKSAEPQSLSEVTATKAAWPLVADGLPAAITTPGRQALSGAVAAAARLTVPTLFQEGQAVALTGPGSALAGLFRSFSTLANRSWQLIGYSIEEIEHGSPAAARFARANVALYIESVYDAHFTLAQIGKKLRDAYKKLGGPMTFGATLAQAEVDSLAQTYSEATARLHPHVGVRLGS
jgi:hypothetical protein